MGTGHHHCPYYNGEDVPIHVQGIVELGSLATAHLVSPCPPPWLEGQPKGKGESHHPLRDRHSRASPGFSLPQPFSAPTAFLSCPSGSSREPGTSPVWRRNAVLVHLLPPAGPSLYPHPTYPGLPRANSDYSLLKNAISWLQEFISPDFWESGAARTGCFLHKPG